MNNSSARGYSDEDDESGLSKKDVGVLTCFSSICKALINLTCCSANSYWISPRLLTEKPQAQEQEEEEQKEEAAGGAAAGGGEKERGEPCQGARGGDWVRDGGACDLRPKLRHLQEDLWGIQGQKRLHFLMFWYEYCNFQSAKFPKLQKEYFFKLSCKNLCLIWERIKNEACLGFHLELYDLLHNSYSSITVWHPSCFIHLDWYYKDWK